MALDLSIAAFQSKAVSGVTSGKGIFMRPDGLMLYVSTTDGGNTLYQYPLSVAFDISTLGATTANYEMAGDVGGDMRTLIFKSDGSKFVAGSRNDNEISYFSMSTPWDLSTVSFMRTSIDLAGGGISDLSGVFIDSTGQHVFITEGSAQQIQRFEDVDYGANDWWGDWLDGNGYFDLSTEMTSPEGVWVNDDGTEIYIVDSGGTPGVHVYTMSTPYDPTTMVHVPASFKAFGGDTTNEGDVRFGGPITG